jgi:hypothetical protein
MTSRLDRRALLRSTAAGAALAPFVPLLEARARGLVPKRLVFFYSSNGTIHERWLPTMNDEGLVLSDILAPLERHKRDLLVVDGLSYSCTDKVKGGHEGGMCAALTGSVPRIVDRAKGSARATGVSVDQHVAERACAGLRLRSLECGIQVDNYDPCLYALSYTGPMQPLMPENDPARVFERVFGRADGKRRDRRSLLDLALPDLARLRARLGADERRKIEGHLDAVREIERTLGTGPGPAAVRACARPADGHGLDVRENDNIPAIGKLHMDIVVAALACDVTRVATIQHGRAGANHRLSWLGAEFMEDPAFVAGKDETRGIHSLAHSESSPVSRDRLVACHAWYASQVAYLVDRLRQIPEGDGTVADHTLVVWMNEMGTGGTHALKNTPWVLVGSAGGHFATGRVLSFPGQPHNGLLLSLCHALGRTDTASFGSRAHCDGPLPGLTRA